MAEHSKWRYALDLTATIAMIVASAAFTVAVVWSMVAGFRQRDERTEERQDALGTRVTSSAPIPVGPIAMGVGAQKGDPAALVAVIEYADFDCRFCANFARDTLPTLLDQYVATGRVLFEFRHLPLESIHPSAFRAAEAAECGGAQGRFWDLHDALFDRSPRGDLKGVVSSQTSLKLDLPSFWRCMGGESSGRIREHMNEAFSLGIRATPTFLFGTLSADGTLMVVRRESGALPIGAFSRILDELIEASENEP